MQKDAAGRGVLEGHILPSIIFCVHLLPHGQEVKVVGFFLLFFSLELVSYSRPNHRVLRVGPDLDLKIQITRKPEVAY